MHRRGTSEGGTIPGAEPRARTRKGPQSPSGPAREWRRDPKLTRRPEAAVWERPHTESGPRTRIGPRGPVRGAADFLRHTPPNVHGRCGEAVTGSAALPPAPKSRPRGVVDTLMRGRRWRDPVPAPPYHAPGFARCGGLRPAVSRPVGGVTGGPGGKRRQCAVGPLRSRPGAGHTG